LIIDSNNTHINRITKYFVIYFYFVIYLFIYFFDSSRLKYKHTSKAFKVKLWREEWDFSENWATLDWFNFHSLEWNSTPKNLENIFLQINFQICILLIK